MKHVNLIYKSGIILIIILLMVTGMPKIDSVRAETEGDYEYKINGYGTVSINKYTGSNTDVVIPEEIAGIKVETELYIMILLNPLLKRKI